MEDLSCIRIVSLGFEDNYYIGEGGIYRLTLWNMCGRCEYYEFLELILRLHQRIIDDAID